MRESKFQRRVELALAGASIHFERPNGDGLPDLLLCCPSTKTISLLELKVAWGAEVIRDLYETLRGTQKHTILDWGMRGYPIYLLTEISKDGSVCLLNGSDLDLKNHRIPIENFCSSTMNGSVRFSSLEKLVHQIWGS
jgi:hypothetical protein